MGARFWATPLSLVFIDGGHTFEAAFADYSSWTPHLMPGGYLLIHDIFADPSKGGQAPRCIYELALASGLFTEHPMTGTLGVLQRIPPAAPPSMRAGTGTSSIAESGPPALRKGRSATRQNAIGDGKAPSLLGQLTKRKKSYAKVFQLYRSHHRKRNLKYTKLHSSLNLCECNAPQLKSAAFSGENRHDRLLFHKGPGFQACMPGGTCEDYGQVAYYLGTSPDHPYQFPLDDHHMFITCMQTCGNTTTMISKTRFGRYFRVVATVPFTLAHSTAPRQLMSL
jgi:hypothetical protein